MQNLFSDFLLERHTNPLIRLFKNQGINIYKALLISIFFHLTLGLGLFLFSDFSSDLVNSKNKEKSLFDVIVQSKYLGSPPQGMSEEMFTQMKPLPGLKPGVSALWHNLAMGYFVACGYTSLQLLRLHVPLSRQNIHPPKNCRPIKILLILETLSAEYDSCPL